MQTDVIDLKLYLCEQNLRFPAAKIVNPLKIVNLSVVNRGNQKDMHKHSLWASPIIVCKFERIRSPGVISSRLQGS